MANNALSYLLNGVRVKHVQFYNRKEKDWTGKVHLYIFDQGTGCYWRACKPEQQLFLHLVGTDNKGQDRPRSVEISCYGCNRVRDRVRKTGNPNPDPKRSEAARIREASRG